MGQLTTDFSTLPVIPRPAILECPVEGITEFAASVSTGVWCGSEFTVVRAEVEGRSSLWGRGWSEHGNLGQGMQSRGDVHSEEAAGRFHGNWQRVRMASSMISAEEGDEGNGLRDISTKGEWGGLVACGGAHCLALV